MSKSVLYEQDDRIVKITLNRPDTRNALSGDIIEGLVEYIQKADKNKNAIVTKNTFLKILPKFINAPYIEYITFS